MEPSAPVSSEVFLKLVLGGKAEAVSKLIDEDPARILVRGRCPMSGFFSFGVVTPLEAAVAYGATSVAEVLLNKHEEMDPIQESQVCRAALKIAIKINSEPMIRLLLRFGVDLNAQWNHPSPDRERSYSPLMYAMQYSHYTAAITMIELGADLLGGPMRTGTIGDTYVNQARNCISLLNDDVPLRSVVQIGLRKRMKVIELELERCNLALAEKEVMEVIEQYVTPIRLIPKDWSTVSTQTLRHVQSAHLSFN